MIGPDRRHFTGMRWGAWLGAFAMLMVFLGPLIGQGSALLHATPTSHAGMADCTEMPGMPGMAHAMPAEGHHTKASGDLAGWEACGYCSLLFQSPALCRSDVFFVRPVQGAPLAPAQRLPAPVAQATFFNAANPRAPPIVIV